MRTEFRGLAAATMLLLATSAQAQVYTVPMKGIGNEWVKQLTLKGTMDWEWIETYPDQVFFTTRQDARRDGDGDHGVNNLRYRAFPPATDWLAQHLGASCG